jgi:ankyrin repeat protein
MLAVSSRDADKVKVLLHAGADPVSRDKEGKTALTLARENDDDEIIKLLLSRGAPQ